MTPYPYPLAASSLLLNSRALPFGDMVYKVTKKYYSLEGERWWGEGEGEGRNTSTDKNVQNKT